MINCEALAFFPAKVLEIIDVYDSLTDPSRKYKKVLTTGEALIMMRDEFVNKTHKLDKVLFDFFVKFVQEVPSS
jgi:HD-GYP domain-containing protein (c-di-GMP phosphodiesterase class II)